MATDRPPRVMDPCSVEFWDFSQQKDFRLQHCASCHKVRWPAADICDNCLSMEYEWVKASGKGSLLSWAIFHRAYFVQYQAPHNTLVVELDEGPLFVTTTPPDVEGHALKDGMRMHLEWLDGQDVHGEYNLPVFRPD